MGQLRTRISIILLTALSITEIHGSPRRVSMSPLSRFNQQKTRANEDYILPKTILPIHYKITLAPNFTDFTFEGEAVITVQAQVATNSIKLHYLNMNISGVTLLDVNNSFVPITNISYDQETQICEIKVQNSLNTDVDYSIIIIYEGSLMVDGSGFYRSSYTTKNGETRWLAVTQFEATDARRAFPCFDEPGFKSVFQINIIRPTEMKSISNTPLNRTRIVEGNPSALMDVFTETSKMSSYLVAFLVFDFEDLSTSDLKHKYSIWVREEVLPEVGWSVAHTHRVIQYMENFTEIDFEYSKLNEAGVPGFSGAMENWGMVIYSESYLLLNEDETTDTKEGTASVIAHELSHQWFGDLVSPAWWKYLWLSEGFAQYFEYFIITSMEPDWHLEEQFIVNIHQYALQSDSSEYTHPISNDVYSPSEIGNNFDSITYDKGGSIIRTSEHFLTHNTFQKGLQAYLRKWAHKSAEADNLFDELENQQKQDGILPSDLNAKTILQSWTTQSGYPVVIVSRTETGIHVLQKRFLENGTNDDTTTWWIPLSYTTQSIADFSNTRPKEWLKNVTEMDISVSLDEDEWIIFNIQESGFYRVAYDEANWKLITDYLKTDDYVKIHLLNRAQLLDDALNLAQSGLLSYDIALNLTTYLVKEIEYAPWQSFFTDISVVDSRLAGTPIYNQFKSYALELINKLYTNLGFYEMDDDNDITKINRANAVKWACYWGQESCVSNSSALFNNWMASSGGCCQFSPNLKSTILCTAIQNGGDVEWKYIWNLYLTSTDSREQQTYLSSLACSVDNDTLNSFLLKAITENSGIRKEDSMYAIIYVSTLPTGVDTALNFVIENFKQIEQVFADTSAINSIIYYFSYAISTQEQANKFQEFVDGTDLGAFTEIAQYTLEIIQTNLNWFDQHGSDISSWLGSYRVRRKEENLE